MVLPDAILTLVGCHPGRIFCRKQTFKAGFTDRHLTEWLRANLVERLAPGWYRVAGDIIPADQQAWLALEYMRCSSGPSPLVSGSTALRSYGVPGIDEPQRPMLLINRGDRVRIRQTPFLIVHACLQKTRRVSHRGLDLSSPARALADLFHECGRDIDRLIGAVDRARNHLRLLTLDLMDEWRGMRRHPGAELLLELAHQGIFDVDSPGERDALDLVFNLCAGMPDCQVTLLPNVRVDFAYLFAGLVIEYYGEVHDGRADRDGTRAMALELANLRVMVLTKSMLKHPQPIAAHVDEVRRRRETLILTGQLERAAIPVQPPRRAPLRTLAPLH